MLRYFLQEQRLRLEEADSDLGLRRGASRSYRVEKFMVDFQGQLWLPREAGLALDAFEGQWTLEQLPNFQGPNSLALGSNADVSVLVLGAFLIWNLGICKWQRKSRASKSWSMIVRVIRQSCCQSNDVVFPR